MGEEKKKVRERTAVLDDSEMKEDQKKKMLSNSGFPHQKRKEKKINDRI